MTPEERQMISDLFERMRSFGPVDKDRDADALILQLLRQTPDAGYKLVQSVLVQENALQGAEARMQDLEQQVAQLQADLAHAQPPRHQQQAAGGGFLGGLFGGKQQPAPSASVPVTGRSAGFGNAQPQQYQPQQQAGNPWGRPAQPQQGYQQGGYQQPMQAQAPAGGGFMRTAMMTAAGVAGGVLAAGAIRDMMGGGSSAQAAGSSATEPSSPYEVNQEPQQQAADQGGGYGYQTEETNDPGNSDFGGGGGDDLDI